MNRPWNKMLWRIALLCLSLILLGFHTSEHLKPWIIEQSARLFPDAPFGRPPRANAGVELYEGVTYERQVRSQPRPLVIHTVRVDLTTPGIGVLVTPHDRGREMAARTTTAFVREFGVQVAINGSYFDPFWVNTPWDYYPRGGDYVRVKGLVISNGSVYSDPFEERPVLCFIDDRVLIDRFDCPPGTTQALAGKEMLVNNGVAMVRGGVSMHPRTAVATTMDGSTLWLIVVDGRQPGYSEGVTLRELAEIALELGADAALNLDGGGSSTLAMAGPAGPELLNAPIHTNIAMRQRPVANHLGVYARSQTRP